MEGITIISTTTTATAAIITMAIGITVAILGSATLGVLFEKMNRTLRNLEKYIYLTIVVIVMGIITGVCGIINYDERPVYEVTIEDEVRFNDVMYEYEIISQNGDVWTIRPLDKGE